jgi:hypothetical protein
MIKVIKSKLYKFATYLLNRLGYQLFRYEQVERLKELNYNLLSYITARIASKDIESIVFSKDRAMQLHAFLLSYTDMVSNRGKMYILYKCSDDRHKKSYEELQDGFRNENFVFIEETNFRSQLIEILDNSDAGKVIFYVDDMIFTHNIDYSVLEKIDTNKYTLALSRGKDMNYSVVLQRPLTRPPFTEIGNSLFQFNWNYLEEFSDWTYPLGVSGYMYGKVEVTSIFKTIEFKAPNSLESAMQLFLAYFKNRLGLCPEYATSVCVHANLVQDEWNNPILGTFSIDELLNLWESGKRIDVHEFYDKPMNITQVQKYTFVNSKEF